MKYCVGIEIGGTKLQIGLARCDQPALDTLVRERVQPSAGAAAIRQQIATALPRLLEQRRLTRSDLAGVGIGFGGPVDAARGLTLVSHQVQGWEEFPLVEWVRDTLQVPAVVQNDADTAALAEARYGAGSGFDPVLYVTVGSGIGGGLIVGGRIYRGNGGGAVEIGHLRPGHLPRHLPLSGVTVESIASGFGIAARARRAIADWEGTVAYARSQWRASSPLRTAVDPEFQERMSPGRNRFARLLQLAGSDPQAITTEMIAQAATEGDLLSLELLSDATYAIGWALAQAVTLLNPARIVIGGGVSLIGEELFFEPVRRACQAHVFEPFASSLEIVPAALGEEVVVHGAIALAIDAFET